MRILVLAASLCVGVTFGQSQYPTTTPVPILKQINRHNEDGSYSYGFEAADGSYKIESKYPDGEVHGKYGFVDDTGNVREIEYGASRRGFEPAGTGINVPPPTLNGNSIADGKDDPEDDGQYREDPSIYYTDPRYTNGERYDPVPKVPIYNHQRQRGPALDYSPATPSRAVAPAYRQPAPAYRQPAPAPTPAPTPAIAAQYQVNYQPQYQAQQYQPQYQPQQYQQPQYQQPQYQQPQYQPAQYQPQEYRPQYKTLAQRQSPAAPQYSQPAAAYNPNQYRNPSAGSYSVNYKR